MHDQQLLYAEGTRYAVRVRPLGAFDPIDLAVWTAAESKRHTLAGVIDGRDSRARFLRDSVARLIQSGKMLFDPTTNSIRSIGRRPRLSSGESTALTVWQDRATGAVVRYADVATWRNPRRSRCGHALVMKRRGPGLVPPLHQASPMELMDVLRHLGVDAEDAGFTVAFGREVPLWIPFRSNTRGATLFPYIPMILQSRWRPRLEDSEASIKVDAATLSGADSSDDADEDFEEDARTTSDERVVAFSELVGTWFKACVAVLNRTETKEAPTSSGGSGLPAASGADPSIDDNLFELIAGEEAARLAMVDALSRRWELTSASSEELVDEVKAAKASVLFRGPPALASYWLAKTARGVDRVFVGNDGGDLGAVRADVTARVLQVAAQHSRPESFLLIDGRMLASMIDTPGTSKDRALVLKCTQRIDHLDTLIAGAFPDAPARASTAEERDLLAELDRIPFSLGNISPGDAVAKAKASLETLRTKLLSIDRSREPSARVRIAPQSGKTSLKCWMPGASRSPVCIRTHDGEPELTIEFGSVAVDLLYPVPEQWAKLLQALQNEFGEPGPELALVFELVVSTDRSPQDVTALPREAAWRYASEDTEADLPGFDLMMAGERAYVRLASNLAGVQLLVFHAGSLALALDLHDRLFVSAPLARSEREVMGSGDVEHVALEFFLANLEGQRKPRAYARVEIAVAGAFTAPQLPEVEELPFKAQAAAAEGLLKIVKSRELLWVVSDLDERVRQVRLRFGELAVLLHRVGTQFRPAVADAARLLAIWRSLVGKTSATVYLEPQSRFGMAPPKAD